MRRTDPSVPVGKSSPAESAQTSGGLLAFFKYHGVWAPGVRLFRRVGFRAKAALISTAFLVPLAVLAWNNFQAAQAQIGFATKERLGVEALRGFMPVVAGLTAARNATRATMGGYDAGADLARARADVDGALSRFDAFLNASGDPLGVRAAHDRLKTVWSATASTGAGASAVGQARTEYGPVVEVAASLIRDIGDNSNLVLDPDVDSFYLVNALVLSLPRVVEEVGQLWGWSTYAAAKGGLSDEEARRYTVWLAGVRRGSADVVGHFERALSATPELMATVDLGAAQAALDYADAVALPDAFLGTGANAPAQIYAQGRDALTKVLSVYAGALPALDGLLEARQQRLAHARDLVLMVTLACLLLAAYLFQSFYLVMNGGLEEVRRHLKAMTDSDLTTTPRPWGRDETASLMLSLADMQASLRAIVTDVRTGSDSIVLGCTEIASGSSDLSHRTEETAASLEESASAMEQIAATVRRTAEGSNEAARLASENATVAGRGGTSISTLVATMQEMQASSRRIEDIIGVIDGIAFQTNILALNAAVEAARAGEEGRGFAVVAGEVRTLAQRSAGAAREIRQLIHASVGKVADGVRVVNEAGQSMQDIVDNARRVDALVCSIATGANEQSTGVSQVGLSIQEIDRATQSNAALVEQTAAAAGSLRQQAEQLAARVARFRLAA
jgi:methyl-accepting chemotaxis protein